MPFEGVLESRQDGKNGEIGRTHRRVGVVRRDAEQLVEDHGDGGEVCKLSSAE